MSTGIRSRRASLVVVGAALLAVVLAGCGRQGGGTVEVTAADGSALATCAEVVAAVGTALQTAQDVESGVTARGAAADRLHPLAAGLRAAAVKAEDPLLHQQVRDLADALGAYLAVLPDPAIGGYPDVAADVVGRLAGFDKTCPVDDPGFVRDARGWAPTTAATGTSWSATAGQAGGPALVVTNQGADGAAVGVTDFPDLVPQAHGMPYRVGLWARALTGTPTLTLTVRELPRKAADTATVTLGPEWTLVAVRHKPGGPGGALDIELAVAGLAAGGQVILDDVAVARG